MAQRPPGAGGWGKRQAPSVKGKIVGSLIDSTTQKALAYASVTLLKLDIPKPAGQTKGWPGQGGQKGAWPKQDQKAPGKTPPSQTEQKAPSKPELKAVNGTLTDESGKFKLNELALGKYTLKITSLGYEEQKIEFELTPKNPDFQLNQVKMIPAVMSLDEVEIVSEKSIIENRIDKIVYNAELDVTTLGGDATDVLRKTPLLAVDLEGNVSLRGSQNLQILINGKPSGMFSQNVGEALQMIPAEEIKSVEVITTPGAKYDGEGSGGIINIITKRKRVQGISGSVGGSVGNRNYGSTLSLAAAKGRFGLNGSGSLRGAFARPGDNSISRQDFSNGSLIRTLNQSGQTESIYRGFGGRFGAFYDFNAYNSLNSSFSMRGRNSVRDGILESVRNDVLAGSMEEFTQDSETRGLFSGYDWTTDFVRTFKKKDQELSFGVQLTGNINNSDYELLQEGNAIDLNRNELGENDGNNRELTFQTDYVQPVGTKLKVETGAKVILRNIDSDYTYEIFDQSENRYFRDLNRSDVFSYQQDVLAGYLSTTWTFSKKVSLVAGARYEYTDISGNYQENENPFEQSYYNILPSGIISYKLKGFANMKLSYTQRIQRPSLRFINPFVNGSDPNNITTGNPLLEPEISNQFELSYTNIFKGITVNAAIFYRKTTDIIEPITTLGDSGISTTNFFNIGENESYGFNFFGAATLNKKITLRGGFNLYSYDAIGVINGQTVSRSAFIYDLNFNGSFNLGKGYKLEAFAFYRSPRQTLQGSRTTFWLYSIGAKKEILKKRGSIGITTLDLFNSFKEFRNEVENDNLILVSSFKLPFRSVGVSFNYKFGKLDFKPERRSKIRNSDQKQGESQNF